MAQLGRNEPCHCGSGKKYKKCCLAAEEATEAIARKARMEAIEKVAAEHRAEQRAWRAWWARAGEEVDDLDDLVARSNAVLGLIHAGQLDEAEQKARELIETAPYSSDGIEHLGYVHEKRGEMSTAAKYYREAADFCRRCGPDCSDHMNWLLDLADRIDPPADPTVPS